MTLFEIRQLNTSELFASLSEKIREGIEKLSDQPHVVVALPGGRSVVQLCRAMLPMLQRLNSGQRAKLQFFMIDERLVDLASPDSNFRMLREEFFQGAINEGLLTEVQLHPFVASNDPQDEALRGYYRELQRYGGRFDIAVVGVGEDAHIAAQFPNHPSILDESEGFIAFDSSPKPPSGRMSASRSLITDSGLLIELFIGEGKREAYQKFLAKEPVTQCPASLVREVASGVVATNLTE